MCPETSALLQKLWIRKGVVNYIRFGVVYCEEIVFVPHAGMANAKVMGPRSRFCLSTNKLLTIACVCGCTRVCALVWIRMNKVPERWQLWLIINCNDCRQWQQSHLRYYGSTGQFIPSEIKLENKPDCFDESLWLTLDCY